MEVSGCVVVAFWVKSGRRVESSKDFATYLVYFFYVV